MNTLLLKSFRKLPLSVWLTLYLLCIPTAYAQVNNAAGPDPAINPGVGGIPIDRCLTAQLECLGASLLCKRAQDEAHAKARLCAASMTDHAECLRRTRPFTWFCNDLRDYKEKACNEALRAIEDARRICDSAADACDRFERLCLASE